MSSLVIARRYIDNIDNLYGDIPPPYIVPVRQLVVQTSGSAVQRVQVGRPAPQSPHPGTPRLPRRGSVVISTDMAISHRRVWRSLALAYKRAWSASFALRRAVIFNAAANGVAGYAAAQIDSIMDCKPSWCNGKRTGRRKRGWQYFRAALGARLPQPLLLLGDCAAAFGLSPDWRNSASARKNCHTDANRPSPIQSGGVIREWLPGLGTAAILSKVVGPTGTSFAKKYGHALQLFGVSGLRGI